MLTFRPLLLLCAMLLVSIGCDQQGRLVEEQGLDKLAKGISSESDVRLVMGQPETVREENGARILEYPKGPEGARTWFFTIDQNGKLQDYQQVLTKENFARVKPGMSREDVRRLLGKPRSVMQFSRKNEEVWDWRYMDGVTPRLFNVHFDLQSGKVTEFSTTNESLP